MEISRGEIVEPLDPQDERLVLALQAQPRARAIRLGEMVGMSAPTVSARMRALTQRGAIEIVGILDYRALPASVIAVALCRGMPHDILAMLPERRGVVFAVQSIGAWDAAVCFVATDLVGAERQIEWLRAHCSAVETHQVVDITVNGLPRQEPVRLRDRLDADIACLLAVDARTSFTAIAEQLEIPEATARSRAQRLLDGHVVIPLVIPHPSLFGLDAAAAMGIEVHAPVAEILPRLLEVPGVITRLHTQGRFAAVVEIIAADVAAVAHIRDAILAIPGVRDVEVLAYGDRYIGRWPLPDEPDYTPVVDRG